MSTIIEKEKKLKREIEDGREPFSALPLSPIPALDATR